MIAPQKLVILTTLGITSKLKIKIQCTVLFADFIL